MVLLAFDLAIDIRSEFSQVVSLLFHAIIGWIACD